MKKNFLLGIPAVLIAVILLAAILSFYIGKNKPAELSKEGIRIVVDMKEREAAVPNDVTKVVTVGAAPIINTFIIALGKGDTLINGLPFTANRNQRSCCKYQAIMVSKLNSMPCIEGGDGLVGTEKLMLLAPQLVFTCIEKNLDIEEQAGIPVFCLSVPKSGSEHKAVMRLMGAVYDKVQAAEEYCAFFDEAVNLISRRIKNIGQSARPKVLYLSGARLTQSSPVLEWLIKTAGGRLPAAPGALNGTGVFSPEDIILWDPDIWIAASPWEVEHIYGNPKFQNLKAVKEKKVYAVPLGMLRWSHPTSEQALGLMWAARLLYPDEFSDISLEKEMKYFYKKFCNYDISDSEIEDILRAGQRK